MFRNSQLPALSSDTNIGRYLDQIRNFPMLEHDEEYMLAKAWMPKVIVKLLINLSLHI